MAPNSRKRKATQSAAEPEEEESYEVEKIVGKRTKNRTLQYLIKWKGYDASQNTWTNAKDCKCPDLIKAYENSITGKTSSTKKPAKPTNASTKSAASNPSAKSTISKGKKGASQAAAKPTKTITKRKNGRSQTATKKTTGLAKTNKAKRTPQTSRKNTGSARASKTTAPRANARKSTNDVDSTQVATNDAPNSLPSPVTVNQTTATQRNNVVDAADASASSNNATRRDTSARSQRPGSIASAAVYGPDSAESMSNRAANDLFFELEIQDMSEQLKMQAIACARNALKALSVETDVAAHIKTQFDILYGGNWHCMVGGNFGSSITHRQGGFIYFYLGDFAILLFRT